MIFVRTASEYMGGFGERTSKVFHPRVDLFHVAV